MKVTIIIPIHNSERYLYECIDSALSQTFKEIEILCIDDESMDSSSKIIYELQKKDNRIVYIKDPNPSYGHKINIGIDRAQGDYIAILESDDRMSLDMVEQMQSVIRRYPADIVDADYYELACYGDKEYRNVVNKYYNPEIYNHFITRRNEADESIMAIGIWTALYKKDFLLEKKIRLNESEGAAYQDTSFMFLTSLFARSVYHINIPYYQYRVDNSMSSVRDDRKIFEVVGEFAFLYNELKRRDITDKNIWRLYYIRKYNTFHWNYRRLSFQSREVFLEKYIEELKSDAKNNYIERNMFDDFLYNRTFLLLDDKITFIEKVIQYDERTFIDKIFKILKETENRNIVIFGAGMWGKKVLKILMQNENRIQAICDNSSQLHGIILNSFEIISVEKAVEQFYGAVFLIINRKHYKEMKEQLLKEGIKENDIIIFT